MDRALAYLNEACMLTSAGLVAAGWVQIRRGRRELHHRLMLAAVGFGVAFFLSYLVKTLLVGDSTFGGPRAWAGAYLAFLQAHVVLAVVAAVLGVWTLRLALREVFSRHRRLGPWTASLWFVAAGTGLVVFLLLYVVYHPGPPVNVVRSITGTG
jgi:putative membrane protein